MKRAIFLALLLFLLVGTAPILSASDEALIRERTEEFRTSILDGDLSIVDRIFESDPSNVYYDINEGPLVGPDRLKRVWRAAIRNSRLTRFDFADDMRIEVDGDRALQTTSWVQTQVQEDGSSRDIEGRASILWRRSGDGWRVYHYHASITPRRPGP